MADEETMSVGGKSKSKLFIFIGVGVVIVLLAVGAAVFFMGGSSEDEAGKSAEAAQEASPKTNTTIPDPNSVASYVSMPRPFLFNLPTPERARLVEIKVQLMVRGVDDDVLTQKHIPLIEDALLTIFSGADADSLSTQEGKDELRKKALLSVQKTLESVTGRSVVEKVLFTGFVMQ